MRKLLSILMCLLLVCAISGCGPSVPMPVYSFLESYDFSSKTIIPFITHGGSRASRTVETIAELQPDASVYDNALVLSRNDVASSTDDVTAWITNIFADS